MFIYFILTVLLLIDCKEETVTFENMSFLFSIIGNTLKVELILTTDPPLDWVDLDYCVISNCDGLFQWDKIGVTATHYFTVNEILNSTCISSQTSANTYVIRNNAAIMEKDLSLRVNYLFHLTFQIVDGAITNGDAYPINLISDSSTKVEHGVSINRTTSSFSAWDLGEDERWVFTKGESAYFKIVSDNTDFITDSMTIELRESVDTSGMNVSEHSTIHFMRESEYIKISFAVPNEPNMGNLMFLYFGCNIDNTVRRSSDNDFFSAVEISILEQQRREGIILKSVVIPVFSLCIIAVAGLICWIIYKEVKVKKIKRQQLLYPIPE